MFQARKITTEYSFKQFFPKNHELLIEDQKIRQTFSLSDKPYLIFLLQTKAPGGWLEQRKFNWLKKSSQALKDLKNVKNVFTFQSLQSSQHRGQDLIIGSPFDESPAAQWPKLARSNSLISPQLLTPDFESTLVLIEVASVKTSQVGALQSEITKQLTALDVTVSPGGSLATQNRLSSLLSEELRLFLALSVLIFCGVFYLLFSRPAALVLIVSSLVLSNLFHLAWLSFFKIPLNVLLSTLPVINSISVMSLVIHTLHLWTQRKSSDAPPTFIAFGVLRELFLPNLLGTLTTSIGFLALSGAQIPIIQQYSWVIALAVFSSWVLTQWVLFVGMLVFARIKNPPQMRTWFDRAAIWSHLSVKFSRSIAVSVLGIALCAAFAFPHLNFNSQLFSELPTDDLVHRTNQWLDSTMGGTVPYELVLIGPSKDYWFKPEHLANLRRTTESMRKFSGIGGVYGPADFFPQTIPKKKAQISELLFLFSLSPEDPTRQFINQAGDQVRLSVKFKDIPSNQILALQDRIDQTITSAFAGIKFQKGGPAVYAHQINKTVSRKLVFGFWESIILIGALLVLSFRSIRWALVACLPNAIAPILMIASLAITNTPIKPSIGLIFSISLGLAFNNTVYFLSRLKSIMQKKKLSFIPLKQALALEGNPCLFETFIMLAGFSIFLVSHFQVNKLFGALMILSIVFGFVGDMVFLPAILKVFPRLLLPRSSLPQSKIHEESILDLTPVTFPLPNNDSKRKVAGWIAMTILLPGPKFAEAAELTASQLLSKTRFAIDAKDESAQVKLVIIEANGDRKIRELSLKSLRKGKKASTLVKIVQPADVRGMGLLSQIENGKESHWIYLPQSKQVRRVVGSQTQGGVLGSELSAGDMNAQILRGAKAKLIQTRPDAYEIEITPSRNSQFSRARLTLSLQFLPLKIQYYQKGRLKKTAEFRKYLRFGNIWRPTELVISNHLNKRGTELYLSNLKINQGFKDSDFSQNALKDDL